MAIRFTQDGGFCNNASVTVTHLSISNLFAPARTSPKRRLTGIMLQATQLSSQQKLPICVFGGCNNKNIQLQFCTINCALMVIGVKE